MGKSDLPGSDCRSIFVPLGSAESVLVLSRGFRGVIPPRTIGDRQCLSRRGR
jgi:hypothetical protein